MITVHLYISGNVQGVGFRWFLQRYAKKFKLFGWVKNTDDGRVEAVLQGDETRVHQLIALCHKGPVIAEVTQVTTHIEEEGKQFQNFSILS